jgi:hypothetical protein
MLLCYAIIHTFCIINTYSIWGTYMLPNCSACVLVWSYSEQNDVIRQIKAPIGFTWIRPEQKLRKFDKKYHIGKAWTNSHQANHDLWCLDLLHALEYNTACQNVGSFCSMMIHSGDAAWFNVLPWKVTTCDPYIHYTVQCSPRGPHFQPFIRQGQFQS